MGYTAGTAMEDRGLRDIERWRDKIEVRLDNRQVFFLFFGSALVACMLFVLGVIVGKRLESRGRAVSPEIEDPWALLDKVATAPRAAQTGVTFPQALFGSKSGAADKHNKKNLLQGSASVPVSTSAIAEKTEPARTVAVVESAKPAPLTKVSASAAEAASAKGAETEAKPEIASKAKPEGKKANEVKADPKAVDSTAKPKVAEVKEVKPAASPVAKPAAIPTIAAGDGKGKGRFSLQLSSFQDKSEAEAFAQKFEGERPYMVVSDIPGKGTWYRVRVGDYASSKDAFVAKLSFEKKHNVIAYVAQK
jgi:DedD protein